MEKITYKNHIITYLDILGFKNIVESDFKNNPEAIMQLLEEFKYRLKFRPEFGFTKPATKYLHYFSDSTTRITHVRQNSDPYFTYLLSLELGDLIQIQKRLVSAGIFIRGAIDFGKLYADNSRFYGDCYHSVVIAEGTLSKFPIIVLCDKIHKRLKLAQQRRGNSFNTRFCNMDITNKLHSYYYVDYLGAELTRAVHARETPNISFLETHKNIIAEAMKKYKHDINILSKYIWLKEYHNQTIRDYILYFPKIIDLKIDK